MFVGNASIVYGETWWFTFDGGVASESGRLEDFDKSDMKRGGDFGFIDVESFVSIGKDIVLGRVI